VKPEPGAILLFLSIDKTYTKELYTAAVQFISHITKIKIYSTEEVKLIVLETRKICSIFIF